MNQGVMMFKRSVWYIIGLNCIALSVVLNIRFNLRNLSYFARYGIDHLLSDLRCLTMSDVKESDACFYPGGTTFHCVRAID